MPKIALIDSHIHLDHEKFDSDRNQVLQRAHEAGISDMIIPGVTADKWPRIARLCEKHTALHATFGLHPLFAHTPDQLAQLPYWLETYHAVAVGECGLDFYHDKSQADIQRFYFQRQLKTAQQMDLPIIIHARKSVEEIIQIIRRAGPLRGVIHSYSGSYEQAIQLADLGFFIGLGGPITYARARRLHRLVKQIPLDILLLETDAPDQPGQCHSGNRNEPAWLVETAQFVATLRNEAVATIATASRKNAQQLFRLNNTLDRPYHDRQSISVQSV